ncbi:MAG: T9SS type A sorting domain-containing protein [Bacteroidales bacterium]|nr:T9SS type A sorting domain-containing protein [Bacteroidales bacterium]
MKRIILSLLFALCAIVVYADNTSWLNFAIKKNGPVLKSIQFNNNGRLTFGESAMHYQDAFGGTDISYEGGAYIFFGSQSATKIKDAIAESGLTLSYTPSAQRVSLVGAEKATSIQIYDIQGRLLRETTNASNISTEGISKGIVIVRATSNEEVVCKKIIIK